MVQNWLLVSKEKAKSIGAAIFSSVFQTYPVRTTEVIIRVIKGLSLNSRIKEVHRH